MPTSPSIAAIDGGVAPPELDPGMPLRPGVVRLDRNARLAAAEARYDRAKARGDLVTARAVCKEISRILMEPAPRVRRSGPPSPVVRIEKPAGKRPLPVVRLR